MKIYKLNLILFVNEIYKRLLIAKVNILKGKE